MAREAITIGTICQRTGQPLHRVRSAIEALEIEAPARAGRVRLFTDAQVKQIAQKLREIDRRRAGDRQPAAVV